MMTSKHYVAIAEAIAVANTREDVAHNLVAVLSADNPRFDRARFLEACQVDA